MPFWFVRLTLLIGIIASFAVQTADWHEYRNVGGNFSGLMPSEPTESADTVEGKTSHTIQAVVKGVGYTVVYVKSTKEQVVDETSFKAYKNGVVRRMPGCAISSEQPAVPAIQNYVGHWYRIDCVVSNTDVSFVGNLYWGKHYRYAVLVMFGAGPSDAPDTKKFVDSFSVIDSTK